MVCSCAVAVLWAYLCMSSELVETILKVRESIEIVHTADFPKFLEHIFPPLVGYEGRVGLFKMVAVMAHLMRSQGPGAHPSSVCGRY